MRISFYCSAFEFANYSKAEQIDSDADWQIHQEMQYAYVKWHKLKSPMQEKIKGLIDSQSWQE